MPSTTSTRARIPFTYAPLQSPELWHGIARLALAFVLVVPHRGCTRRASQNGDLGKQVLLWVVFVILVYGLEIGIVMKRIDGSSWHASTQREAASAQSKRAAMHS